MNQEEYLWESRKLQLQKLFCNMNDNECKMFLLLINASVLWSLINNQETNELINLLDRTHDKEPDKNRDKLLEELLDDSNWQTLCKLLQKISDTRYMTSIDKRREDKIRALYGFNASQVSSYIEREQRLIFGGKFFDLTNVDAVSKLNMLWELSNKISAEQPSGRIQSHNPFWHKINQVRKIDLVFLR